MSDSSQYGKSQTLYEVVANGVGRKRYKEWPNAHRVKIRTCDDKGDDIFAHECKFPFTWNGTTYNDCTTDGTDNLQGWRIQNQKRNSNKHNVFSNEDVQWGFCIPEDEETVPRQNQYVTRLTCGENYHHTCGM